MKTFSLEAAILVFCLFSTLSAFVVPHGNSRSVAALLSERRMSDPRYSDFLYPTDPSERKVGDSYSTSLPVSSKPTGSAPQDANKQSSEFHDVYENEELSIDELREQVERLLLEEEEAERAERQRLLKMRSQLLERKRKREQDNDRS